MAGCWRRPANLQRGHDQFTQVPVMTARGWTEAEKRAYAIADNQSALMAGWNDVLLASELQAAAGAGLDVATLGFTDAEIRRRLGYAGGLTDPTMCPSCRTSRLPNRVISGSWEPTACCVATAPTWRMSPG